MPLEPAPFRPGDRVRYMPSDRGHSLDANAPDAARLEPGQVYVVREIQHGSYVVVEGYDHPGGGLYWTEFSPLNPASAV